MGRKNKIIQVEEEFLKDLWTGLYDPEKPLPAEETLAERYGISRISFRKVVLRLVRGKILMRIPNKHTLIHPELILPGRKIRNKKNQIAVLIDALPDSVTVELLCGIKQSALEQNVEVILFQNTKNGLLALEELKKYGSEKISGLLVLAISPEFSKKLKEMPAGKLPMVALWGNSPELNIPSVFSDDFNSGEKVTEMLISRFFRPVYYVGESSENFHQDRFFGGYCCAMVNGGYGKSLSSFLEIINWKSDVDYIHNDALKEKMIPEVRNFFLKHPEPLTIVAENDYLCRVIFNVAKEFKRIVGEDLILCGRGNLPFSAEKEYSVSSIKPLLQEQGYYALRFLLNRIRHRESVVYNVIFPAAFIERNSTRKK